MGEREGGKEIGGSEKNVQGLFEHVQPPVNLRRLARSPARSPRASRSLCPPTTSVMSLDDLTCVVQKCVRACPRPLCCKRAGYRAFVWCGV